MWGITANLVMIGKIEEKEEANAVPQDDVLLIIAFFGIMMLFGTVIGYMAADYAEDCKASEFSDNEVDSLPDVSE